MPWLWRALGVTSVAIGMVGVVVPLLPTTPFLLLAGWAFARSSARLHRWLLDHPHLGPPIADWRRQGAVSARLKLLTVLSLLASLAIALLLAAPPRAAMAQSVRREAAAPGEAQLALAAQHQLPRPPAFEGLGRARNIKTGVPIQPSAAAGAGEALGGGAGGVARPRPGRARRRGPAAVFPRAQGVERRRAGAQEGVGDDPEARHQVGDRLRRHRRHVVRRLELSRRKARPVDPGADPKARERFQKRSYEATDPEAR